MAQDLTEIDEPEIPPGEEPPGGKKG
jgi:hypothetical protein